MKNSLLFKIAENQWEFEKINRLNYETFVEEIPQHEVNEDRMLQDKFDKENIYFIGLHQEDLVAMVALRDSRPFSLDQKLKNLDSYLPAAKKLCEVRLLSVKKEYRNGLVLTSLLQKVMEFAKEKDYDMILISGILNQQKLYKHIGFIPFGPIVGNEQASFQPMYITQELCKLEEILKPKNILSLLPGPVEIPAKVQEAFHKIPISHRTKEFKNIFGSTKKLLCSLVNAKHVELFMGSGTLANDIITAQLSLLKERGLILSNGEFGDRLIDHGVRFDLQFETYRLEWGQVFDVNKLKTILDQNKDIKWLYMVYGETSTGILNDVPTILEICKNRNIHLCLDTISTVGTVEINLEDVYFASSVSGKGLSSYCGLAMVFYNHELISNENKLPRYFDLHKYKIEEGIPYTISSNLVSALHCSLKNLNKERRINNSKNLSAYFRQVLEKIGLRPLISAEIALPSVITLPIPTEYSSKDIGDYLKGKNYLVSYESSYLLKRNWIQICFMGDIVLSNLENLATVLESYKMKYMK